MILSPSMREIRGNDCEGHPSDCFERRSALDERMELCEAHAAATSSC